MTAKQSNAYIQDENASTSSHSYWRWSFHLQNVHCIKFIKKIKRCRFNSKVKTMLTWKKQFKQIKNYDADVKLNTWSQFTFKFVNETTKLCDQRNTETSQSSLISSKRFSSLNIFTTNEITNVTKTSTSFICIDIFNKLDFHLHNK